MPELWNTKNKTGTWTERVRLMLGSLFIVFLLILFDRLSR